MAMQPNGKFHKAVDLSSTDFTDSFDWLFIEGTGDITIVDYNDDSVTITVPSNHVHNMGGKQITKASTTATGITAYKFSSSF